MELENRMLAAVGKRLDVARRIRSVPQRDAQLSDRGVETRVEVHDSLRPQLRNELFTGYDAPTGPDELYENL